MPFFRGSSVYGSGKRVMVYLVLCIIEEPGDHSRAEEEVEDGGGGGDTEGGGEEEERGEVGGGDGCSEGLEMGTVEVGDDQPPPPPAPVAAAAEAAEVRTCTGTV